MDDILFMKNELYVCWVLLFKFCVKIFFIDYFVVFEILGVVDKVDKDDMLLKEVNKFGFLNFDEVFFVEDEVFIVGQFIVMMLVKFVFCVEEVVRVVKVEYEELFVVLIIEEVIEYDSFYNVFCEIKKGDIEEVFKKCDYVFIGIVRMGG